MKIYDIVIVGGGFVGVSALMALSRLSPDLKVALIDARAPAKPEADQRSIVLSYASQQIFSRWGDWEDLQRDAFPLMSVHVSEAGRLGRLKITAKDQGVPALGYVLPADKLITFFHEKTKHLDYFYAANCTDLSRIEDKIQLKIQTMEADLSKKEENWLASLVLVADGVDSTIRAKMGIPVKYLSYEQSAIVTQVTVKHPNQVGYERFIGGEVLAMVPRGEGVYGAIWKVDRARANELMRLSAENFMVELNRVFVQRLGVFSGLGVRKAYPLRFVRAFKETLPGLVFLGDAAHALPPVAAQGLNLSLRDIAVLADKIEVAIMKGIPFWEESFLREYESQRLLDQAQIISLINFPLTGLFRQTPSILKGLGWLGMDLCQTLKHRFANTMMGRGL